VLRQQSLGNTNLQILPVDEHFLVSSQKLQAYRQRRFAPLATNIPGLGERDSFDQIE